MSWRCFFSIETTSIAVQPPMPISSTSIGRDARLRPPTSGAPSMVMVWPLPPSATSRAPSTQEILAVVDISGSVKNACRFDIYILQRSAEHQVP